MMKRETNLKVGDVVRCIYQEGGLRGLLLSGGSTTWEKAYGQARDSGLRYVVGTASLHMQGHQLLTFKDLPSPVHRAHWIGYFFELASSVFTLSDVDE